MTIEQLEILDVLKKREAALIMAQLELAKKHPELFKVRYKCKHSDLQEIQSIPEDALYGLERTSCMPMIPMLCKDLREVLAGGFNEPILVDLLLDKGV